MEGYFFFILSNLVPLVIAIFIIVFFFCQYVTKYSSRRSNVNKEKKEKVKSIV